MRTPELNHLAVLVRDLARAEHFYAQVLGLPVVRRWDDEEGFPRSVWVGLGEHQFLALERARGRTSPEATRKGDPPGWHCVAFDIAAAEREAWRIRLETAGFPIERETDYTLYARDPDGNLLGLSHFPERVAGAPRP